MGSSSSGSSSTDPVEQLKGKFDSFVKEASPKVVRATEDLMDNAKKAASRLDSEYEISRQAEKAAKKAKEAVFDVDSQYGIRRRLRAMQEDVARHWPAWKRAFDEFSVTPLGKFSIIAGILAIMTTSVFWKVLNWVIFLWWLAIPILSIVVQQAAVKQAQAQAAAEEEEQERRKNPFASMFRNARSSMGGMGGSPSGGFGSKSSSSRSGSMRDSGPIIDAEWKPLDK